MAGSSRTRSSPISRAGGIGGWLFDSFSGSAAGLALGATGAVMVLIGFSYWMGESSTRKGLDGEQSAASELSYLNDEFLLPNDVMLPEVEETSTTYSSAQRGSSSLKPRTTQANTYATEIDGSSKEYARN